MQPSATRLDRNGSAAGAPTAVRDVAELLTSDYASSAPLVMGELLALFSLALTRFDDLEDFAVFAAIFHRSLPPAGVDPAGALQPGRGTNLRSVADSLGLSRESVRRKVAALIERGWVERRERLVVVTPKAREDLVVVRQQLFRSVAKFDAHLARLRS